MREIRFTAPFKRRLKQFPKDYRRISEDIQPVIDDLQQRNLIGHQITGVSQIVYKARAKNSNIPTGKSGGYGLIYQVVSNQIILR